MGMFDEIVCDYPLPGTVPAYIEPGHRFQTKDLDCQLDTYKIAADGTLSIPAYTGTIDFYTTNCCAGHGGFQFTHDGSDVESVDFRATFVDSKITHIEQTNYERRDAIHAGEMKGFVRPTEADKRRWKARQSRKLIGQSLYVLWGGHEDGNAATCVAETDKELCLLNADGSLKVHDRRDIDSLVFDTEQDAKDHRQSRIDENNDELDRYRKILAAKSRPQEPAK